MLEAPLRSASTSECRQRIVAFGCKGPSSFQGAGGIERGIEHLAPLMTDRGFEFIAYARANERHWIQRKGVSYRGTRYVNSKHMAHWTHSLSSVWDYLWHRKRGDVIHVHGIDKAFLCPLFSTLGHRVIFVLHGREWRARKWSPLMRRIMRLCRLPMMRFSDTVVTVCRPSLHELSQRYPQYAHKLLYIPNGLPSLSTTVADLSVFDEISVKPDEFFLYSGRLVPQKGIDLILEALARLPGKTPLVIAGTHSHTEDYVEHLESIIHKNQLEDRVHFVGHRSLEQLVGLYSTCRAVVLPSETEGCSQTLLEAMACGICVICSDLPENRDVTAEAAIYVKTGDSDGLLDAMLRLQDDVTMRDYRNRAAGRRKYLTGWQEIARKYSEFSIPR